FVDSFLQHGIRLLLLPRSQMMPEIDLVGQDLNHAANQAVQHLAVLGHRDIVFVCGNCEDALVEMPVSAYSSAMKKIGIEVGHDRIVQDTSDDNDDLRVLQKMLEPSLAPTAIVCSSDVLALKVLKAISANGLNVPDDISVIGFGDICLARHAHPPLTTI